MMSLSLPVRKSAKKLRKSTSECPGTSLNRSRGKLKVLTYLVYRGFFSGGSAANCLNASSLAAVSQAGSFREVDIPAGSLPGQS